MYSKRAHYLQVLLHKAPHVIPIMNVLLRSWRRRDPGSSYSPASSHVTLSKSFHLSWAWLTSHGSKRWKLHFTIFESSSNGKTGAPWSTVKYGMPSSSFGLLLHFCSSCWHSAVLSICSYRDLAVNTTCLSKRFNSVFPQSCILQE